MGGSKAEFVFKQRPAFDWQHNQECLRQSSAENAYGAYFFFFVPIYYFLMKSEIGIRFDTKESLQFKNGMHLLF